MDRRSDAAVLSHPDQNLSWPPRTRHIFAFSQSPATVASRAAAILASVVTEMLNSPRSIAPNDDEHPDCDRESSANSRIREAMSALRPIGLMGGNDDEQ
jgi:hypothetical protein